MNRISKYGIITDDVHFASSLASYLFENSIFLPILSLPRMNRDDWENEVLKRTVTINRSKIEYLFCKSKDYGLLAPVRKYIKAELMPLKKPSYVKRFFNIKSKREESSNSDGDNIRDFLSAISQEKIYKKTNNNCGLHKNNINYENNSDTLLVLEKSDTVTDIASLVYALANGYDIMIINKVDEIIAEELINCLIKFADNDYVCLDAATMNDDNINRLFRFLEKRITYLIDYKSIELKYKKVQFIVNKVYLGVLIDKIPVAHLLHLQADLHLLNEYYYLEKYRIATDNNIPSFLFVDTQEEGLSSEIPDISTNLNGYKNWKFFLSGKNATLLNFKIFSHFFPYEVLLITGHGSSPNARIAFYKFKSRNGNEHVAKVIEYFQISQILDDDNVEMELKHCPLEFDGISWKDKKMLKKQEIPHIFYEFTLAHKDLELINCSKIKLNKIEGIKLYDGIFMGFINSFETNNNPVILLNSCGSLVEAGEIVNFGIPRVLIGTLWPVLDGDANKFAVDLFDNIQADAILSNFYKARDNVKNKYTKFSYIILSTLNQYLPMKKSVDNIKEAEGNMFQRIQKSITEICRLFYQGYIEKHEIKAVLKYIDVCNKFVESKYPENHELRSNLKTLRNDLTR